MTQPQSCGANIKSDTNKSYARYQIKWQPEMIKILHKHMFELVPDPKNGLLSGFLS
jgi:hypothetical protein